MTTGEIQWIAGFLEGEACWSRGMTITVGQVQRWPLEKLHDLCGGRITPKKNYNPNASPAFTWYLCGPSAAALSMTLYSLMSPKRRLAIRSALDEWRAKPFRSQHRQHCPRGHPYDLVVTNNGAPRRRCRACDNAFDRLRWAKRRPERRRRIRMKVAMAEHRPCLCGCGALVSILSNAGKPRLGWIHNHDKRRISAGAA
jgi:hypothetical protein